MTTLKSPKDVVPSTEPSLADESASTHSSTTQAEKRLIRKLDIYIVPLIIISYLLIFLDRSNLGNAKIASLPQDLGLHGNEINCTLSQGSKSSHMLTLSTGSVSIFYATFVVFEIPITLLVKPLGPSKLSKSSRTGI